MTLTDRKPANPSAVPDATGPVRRRRSDRAVGIQTVVAVLVVVALLAQFPLIKNHIFYYWDDSAAAFLPDWYQMGTQLRGGHWPVLDPNLWMGGNFAAESMLGVFNPVSLGNFVVVSLLPDLALAATLVKTEFLMLLALGVYLLAREYRANRPAAAIIATALPFTGYTLYFDAEAWIGGLMAYAWIPFVWWALRRYARGVSNPIVPIIFGYLAMTTGNPYGALAVIVVLLAVGVEQLVQRDWRRFGGVVVVGAIIGIASLAVFLPLLGSSAVTWRQSMGVANDGFMVPNLGDLIGMSAPTFQPQFRTFGSTPTFPAFYVAWFILPLAPWLSWSVLRQRVRERFGIAVFGAVFLVLLVGPSALWLFRWPARLTEYATLPIALVFAIVFTHGFRTSYPLRRWLATAAIVLFGAYLSWSSTPAIRRWHELALLVVAVLVVAALFAALRRPKVVAPVLVAGTAVVLLLQAVLYTGNFNITPWRFPHNVAAMKANYGARYHGNTLQVADPAPLVAMGVPITPEGAWQDLALASAMHVSGVSSLNDYTGIGDLKFSNALCMTYYGGTCADAYRRLWLPADGTTTDLAGVLNLQTVVVVNGYQDPNPNGTPAQNRYVNPDARLVVPPGWSVQEKDSIVTVLHRDTPVAWPNGRLSWNGTGVTVASDQITSPTGERATYSGSGGRVVFAMMAWPGWQATVDGRSVPIEQGPAGMLQLDLPAAAAGSVLTLSFTPPGYTIGIPLVGFGLLIGVGYAVLWGLRRRRDRLTDAATDDSAEDGTDENGVPEQELQHTE